MLPWVSPCRLPVISFFVRGLIHLAVLADRVLADCFGCSRGFLSKSFLLMTSLSSSDLRRSVVSVGWQLVDSCSRSVRKHRFSGSRSRHLRPRTGPDGPWIEEILFRSTLLLPRGRGCSVSAARPLRDGRAGFLSKEDTFSWLRR
jgi:hypothetical protein